MCGRFASSRQPADLAEEFGLDAAELPEPLPIDFNVAPTKNTYAVVGRSRRAPDGPASGAASGAGPAGPAKLIVVRWGLVPGWAKDPSVGTRLINARIETAPGKPAFRRAFAARRCLIPADGYFEWLKLDETVSHRSSAPRTTAPRTTAPRTTAPRAAAQAEMFPGMDADPQGGPEPSSPKPVKKKTAKRLPYFIKRADGGVLALAGLHEVWRDRTRPDDDPAAWLHSVTVLTTASTGPLAAIHERMPVVVTAERYEAWLDPALTDPDRVSALVAAQPVDELVAYPVSSAVNDVRHGGPELVQPVPPPEGLDAPAMNFP